VPHRDIDARTRRIRSTPIAAVALCAIAMRADAQWLIGSPQGDTLRIGYTLQTRAEWLQADPAGPTAQTLFLRHARLLLSGRLKTPITFFLGTDSPNLGKAQLDGTKNTGSWGVYDLWATYDQFNALKVDAGLIGTPNSHNSIQSIAGMLTPDFGPYSFVSTPPTQARAGRDYGAQARGYLWNDHVEYRGAVFEGYRGAAASMPFRYLARVVVDAFRAEKSVYYSGTSLGLRRSLAVGVSVDHQQHYNSAGADVYFDHPVASGDGVTLQVDVVGYNGNSTFPDFPKQRTTLVEAGYFWRLTRLTPFFQLSRLDFAVDSLRDEKQYLGGVAYFIGGHSLNVKGMYGRMQRRGLPGSTLFQLTFQSFEF